MSVEEFNLARIDALENRVKELEERLRKHEEKESKDAGHLGCGTPECVCQ